jgi:manganese/zinc/iron transport system substrate-binding protein
MKSNQILAGIMNTALIFMIGCGGQPDENAPGKAAGEDRRLKVVTTTGMINDIVQNVGGVLVASQALMGSGVDPHLYKASEGDMRRLASADVIFYNGLHLEAKMADVLEKMNRRVRTVAVAEVAPQERLLSPPEFAGAHDPHVWMDVSLWMLAVTQVRDTLSELAPAHATEFETNADRYLLELSALNDTIRPRLATIPEAQRVLVTAHDAFGYFGRAYDIEVRGLQGISTISEAGTSDVQELAYFIAERRIPAIFIESSVSPRAIEAVQAAVAARGFTVHIGGELFSDAMGNPGTAEGTYLGMIRHNVDTIVSALRPKKSGS